MKVRTQCIRDRRGVALVETSVVLMTALTLILAVYEYGRYFMLSQLVNNAAREGARAAVANTSTQNTAMIQSTVVQYLANQGFMDSSGNGFNASDVVILQVNPATGAPMSPDSNWYDAPFGSGIMVQINAKFTPFLPTFGILPTTVSLHGTAVMLSEAN